MSGVEVLVPLTCGELVQGVVDDHPFLVSCPIDRFARVRVTINATGEVSGPPNHPKVLAAVMRTLRYLNHSDVGVTVEVTSPLPRSRGFGTSTADVVGAVVATARAVGHTLTPEHVGRLAVSVEPSDSTMFPGLALFDYRNGAHGEMLGTAPAMAIVVLDFGGAIDTVRYNARLDRELVRRQNSLHVQALALLRDGLARRDLAAIGEAAPLSACAHSGTALGILAAPDARYAGDIVGRARAAFPELVAAWVAQLGDGGARTRGPVATCREQQC
ncbi:MAG TPA: hypothetical protein VNF73_09335 [Candidatus Saccharimonadales bacterium]|nr:hypothetical protein [Candidatus Saccharimonadales bacterium]HVC32816.1 hypothetical protein [Chloroflexota bacterium]